jgi:lysophospholipase L1-like esterase
MHGLTSPPVRVAVVSAAIVAALAVAPADRGQAATVEAGPILSSRDAIAIVGDSYSAGEGADAYLPESEVDANPCHRSPRTYLVAALGVRIEGIIACSGAVAADVHFSQEDRTVAPQVEQLKRIRRRGGVDAVVLTLGGNDAGFVDVGASCLIGGSSCAKYVYTDLLRHFHRHESNSFVDERLAALPAKLRAAYLAVNYEVNGPEPRAAGGPVPILVLAYPVATPRNAGPCPRMRRLLAEDEIGFLNGLAKKLNGTIARTAAEVRSKDAAPVFYVRSTEGAFRPDHTLCDSRPYIRTPWSLDGAGRRPDGAVLDPDPSFWRRLTGPEPWRAVAEEIGPEAALRWFKQGVRELLHPNPAGYVAISRAVLRWSRGPAATDARSFLEGAPVATPPAPVAHVVTEPDLGRIEEGTTPTLEAGSSYPLTLGGFAPGAEVEIGARSALRTLGYARVDGEGEVEARIAIPPDLEPGDHTLVIAGGAANGRARRVEVPFRIAGGDPVAGLIVLGVGILLLTGGAVALVRRR